MSNYPRLKFSGYYKGHLLEVHQYGDGRYYWSHHVDGILTGGTRGFKIFDTALQTGKREIRTELKYNCLRKS